MTHNQDLMYLMIGILTIKQDINDLSNFFVIKANFKTDTLEETVRIFIYINKVHTYNVLNA